MKLEKMASFSSNHPDHVHGNIWEEGKAMASR